jgi:two-component system cell cycle response regulator
MPPDAMDVSAGHFRRFWETDPFVDQDVAAAIAAARASGAGGEGEAAAWIAFLDAFLAMRRGDAATARPLIEDSVRIAMRCGARRVARLAGYLAGFDRLIQGDHEDAVARFTGLLADDDGELTPFDRAIVGGNLGTAMMMAGRLQDAVNRLFECCALLRLEKRETRLAVALTNIGGALNDLGDFASAADVCSELATLKAVEDFPRLRVAVPMLALSAHLSLGDDATAFGHAAKVAAMVERQPLVPSEAQVPSGLAESFIRRGDAASARYWLSKGEELAPEAVNKRAYGLNQRIHAALALLEGNSREAVEHGRLAVKALAGEGFLIGHLQALETLAQCEQAAGEFEAASNTWAEHVRLAKTVANGANQSRHYFLKAQFDFARLREERDQAEQMRGVAEAHSLQVGAMNRQLADQLAQLEILRAELAEQAIRDTLTGLYNRRHLTDAFHALNARAASQGLAVGFALIDVDHFKRVNDTWGHGVGDSVLRVVAAALLRGVREEDVVVRYGGEEFCVLCACAAPQLLIERLETVRAALAAATIRSTEPPLSGIAFSAGVVLVRQGERLEDAGHRADLLLYQAKAAGRNRTLTG